MQSSLTLLSGIYRCTSSHDICLHSLRVDNVTVLKMRVCVMAQALKAQALTLLASWVVAEPSLAVANKLHQQDLPNRILEDLVNRAHHFLPGPHAGMAVQVHAKVLHPPQPLPP